MLRLRDKQFATCDERVCLDAARMHYPHIDARAFLMGCEVTRTFIESFLESLIENSQNEEQRIYFAILLKDIQTGEMIGKVKFIERTLANKLKKVRKGEWR